MNIANIRKQKGLSLVETMIALTLGAIVTVGVVQLFVANSETYNLLQGQSRMQESARFALNFLARDVQLAGYKGCFSTNEDVFSVANDPTNLPFVFDIIGDMTGYEGDPAAGTWSPPLSELPDTAADDSFVSGNGIPIDDVVVGTDVLVIRRISSIAYPLDVDLLKGDEVVVGEPQGVEFSTDGVEFEVGDLALIHDCQKATVFRITGLNVNTDDATIYHAEVGTDPFDNDLDYLARENSYQKDAAVSAIKTNIYYIAPGTGENNQGDAPLSLWRKSGKGPPIELVEGVEQFQVLYGEDTDNDGTPNIYNNAQVATFADVVTMEINIVVNSVDDVGATSEPTHKCVADGGLQPCLPGESHDGLLRRNFRQTVQLRNNG